MTFILQNKLTGLFFDGNNFSADAASASDRAENTAPLPTATTSTKPKTT